MSIHGLSSASSASPFPEHLTSSQIGQLQTVLGDCSALSGEITIDAQLSSGNAPFGSSQISASLNVNVSILKSLSQHSSNPTLSKLLGFMKKAQSEYDSGNTSDASGYLAITASTILQGLPEVPVPSDIDTKAALANLSNSVISVTTTDYANRMNLCEESNSILSSFVRLFGNYNIADHDDAIGVNIPPLKPLEKLYSSFHNLIDPLNSVMNDSKSEYSSFQKDFLAVFNTKNNLNYLDSLANLNPHATPNNVKFTP